MANPVIKYAVTAVGPDGLRYLCRAFETEPQAAQWLTDVTVFSDPAKVKSVLGEDLQVRPVECWPTSGDPKRVVFED